MKRVTAWLVVLVVILGAYSYKTDPKLASSCVGPAPSAMVVSSRVLRRMGELVNADPHPPAAIKADVDKVMRVLRLLWWSLKFSSNKQKIPPEIITLEKADDERRRNSPLCSAALAEECPPPPPPADAPPPAAEPFDPKLASLRAGSGLTTEQLSIVATAVQVAADRHLPSSAPVVAVTAGLVESEVSNLNHGDRDSLGWLQQRPSTGWGTPAQVRNPRLAVEAFYGVAAHTSNRGLTDVPNWQNRPVGEVAQAVQVSAFPGRYQARVAEARRLVASVGAGDSQPPAQPPAACTPATATPGPPGARGGGPVPADFNRQGNPRTVEQAIAWMERNMPRGAPGEPVLNACERYMNLSYGLDHGYGSAVEHWNAPGPRTAGMSTPPRGALVFWDTDNAAEHVGLSLGNSQGISTDYDVLTGRYRAGVLSAGPLTDIDKWGPRLGWRVPNFRVGTEGANA